MISGYSEKLAGGLNQTSIEAPPLALTNGIYDPEEAMGAGLM